MFALLELVFFEFGIVVAARCARAKTRRREEEKTAKITVGSPFHVEPPLSSNLSIGWIESVSYTRFIDRNYFLGGNKNGVIVLSC